MCVTKLSRKSLSKNYITVTYKTNATARVARVDAQKIEGTEKRLAIAVIDTPRQYEKRMCQSKPESENTTSTAQIKQASMCEQSPFFILCCLNML